MAGPAIHRKRDAREEKAPSVLDGSCMDCGINTRTSGEYYALKDSLWRRINPLVIGMLCLACAEDRLGRPLCGADFSAAPINATSAAACRPLARRLKRAPPRSGRSMTQVKPRLQKMAEKHRTQSRLGFASFQLLTRVGRNGRVMPDDIVRVLRDLRQDPSWLSRS